jgi:hypothetical protein
MQYATHAGILSSHLSTTPSGMASLMWERSPTHPAFFRNLELFILRSDQISPLKTQDKKFKVTAECHSFGTELNPRWIVGALSHSTSELLRTL